MSNKVQKMLSPEETSLLQDVMSGLQALLTTNNVGPVENPVEGTGAQQVQMSGTIVTPDNPNTPQTPQENGQPAPQQPQEATKSNDGPTANDNAESRTQDGTNITEDNLAGVAKALLALGNLRTAPVTKSVDQTSAAAIAQTVVKSLEPVLNRVATVEKDMSSLLDVLGITDAMDQVEKAQNPIDTVQKSMNGQAVTPGVSQTSQQVAPVTNPDTMELIKMVATAVGQEVAKGQQTAPAQFAGATYRTASTEAHKELGSAIVETIMATKGV